MKNTFSRQQIIYTLLLAVAAVIAIFFIISQVNNGTKQSKPVSDSSTTTATTTTTTASTQATSEESQYRISVATSTQETDAFRIVTDVPQGSFAAAVAARDFVRSRQSAFTQFVAENTQTGTSTYQPTYSFTAELQVYQTERYVSFVYRINEYTGGAHANTYVRTFVEDKTTEQVINVRDLAKNEDISDFAASVRAKLQNPTETDVATSQLFSDAVADLQLQDLDNFYITDDHIVVLFSPYTIAPGAAGVVSAQIDR